jgi:hypothetical protein
MDTPPFAESAKPSLSYVLVIAAGMAAGDQSMLIGGRRAWNTDDYQACWDELERLCPENYEGQSSHGYSEGEDAGSAMPAPRRWTDTNWSAHHIGQGRA